MKEFERLSILGFGSFGIVLKVKIREGNDSDFSYAIPNRIIYRKGLRFRQKENKECLAIKRIDFNLGSVKL